MCSRPLSLDVNTIVRVRAVSAGHSRLSGVHNVPNSRHHLSEKCCRFGNDNKFTHTSFSSEFFVFSPNSFLLSLVIVHTNTWSSRYERFPPGFPSGASRLCKPVFRFSIMGQSTFTIRSQVEWSFVCTIM